MIQTRNFLTVLLLSLVTGGIYFIYFLYTYIQDVNKVCAGDGQEDMNFITMILLSAVTCGIYGMYWYYCLGNRLQNNAARYGLTFQENGTTFLLWMILGSCVGIGPWVVMHFMVKDMNEIAAVFNQNAQA